MSRISITELSLLMYFYSKMKEYSVLLYYFCYVQVFLLISYFSNGVGKQLGEESCGGQREGRPSRSSCVHSSYNNAAA